ncbi:MAG TPA: hypothetical protein VGX94_09875 [Terriglobia bacterium]|nr:hypothetical protein [Terriglobia bacterium]
MVVSADEDVGVSIGDLGRCRGCPREVKDEEAFVPYFICPFTHDGDFGCLSLGYWVNHCVLDVWIFEC